MRFDFTNKKRQQITIEFDAAKAIRLKADQVDSMVQELGDLVGGEFDYEKNGQELLAIVLNEFIPCQAFREGRQIFDGHFERNEFAKLALTSTEFLTWLDEILAAKMLSFLAGVQ